MTSDTALGVIALVPDDWHAIVMPRHQVLRRLATHFPTVWIEPARNWRHFLPFFGNQPLAPDRWSEPARGLEVLRTGWRHPTFHRPSWLAAASFRSRLSAARQRLSSRGAKRIALYIWRDEFAAALDLVDHDFSCYHIDDEYSFSDKEMPISGREMQLLRRVDQIIVHSPALFEKKGRVNPRTALVSNGVDFKHFSNPHAEPPDMAPIPHPRIGYAGVIKKQLDLALLTRLARRMPQHSFVLVGPVMNVSGKEADLAELRRLPNVYMLGRKSADDVPRYMQHFDVCLMCYEVNEYTKYIYPLKLNEYLATGRPVVSAPIDAVKGYSDVVAIASSDAEYVHAIEQGLSSSTLAKDAVAARQRIARSNDWDVLVGRIADLFQACDTAVSQGPGSPERSSVRGVVQRPAFLFILPWDLHVVGGVNGVVRNLAKAMREKGSLEPLIAVNSWEDSTPRKSIDVFRFRFSIFGALSGLGVLKAVAAGPLRLWRTFRLLRKYNVRAVNFHFPGIAPFGVAVLKRLGLFRGELILSYHGTDVAPPGGRFERLLHAFVRRSADHLVACSNSLAERMSSQFRVPISRVDVILNGVDASVFDGVGSPDSTLPHQLPPKFILNVGAFIPRKNHTLLLRAFALLKDRYPALHLCIAGADGSERLTVEAAVHTHELSERVHLFVDLDEFQVALLLSKATLCVQTSLVESFPLAVLEAGASGIPLVVSDIPGHQEMVYNGRTGSLFPLGDPSACANAIAAMLDDPNAAARMAAEQKALVRKDRTWVSSVQQYERLVCST